NSTSEYREPAPSTTPQPSVSLPGSIPKTRILRQLRSEQSLANIEECGESHTSVASAAFADRRRSRLCEYPPYFLSSNERKMQDPRVNIGARERTVERPLSSIGVLMAGAIDYAGLFPPSAVSMADAVENYAAYRRGEYSWMLGRFVVTASRLNEFAAEASKVLKKGEEP